MNNQPQAVATTGVLSSDNVCEHLVLTACTILGVSRRSLSLLLLTAVLQAQTPSDRRGYWDDLFRKGQIRFNTEASKLLQYAIAERKPGRAIDLGMGEGRNAVFLASKGWEVTGVDFSEAAVQKAKARAAAARVSINAIVEDLDQFELGREKWDLIALFYMHAWFHESGRNVARLLAEGLKPGGLLVIEGYAGDKGDYRTNELLRTFDGLRILHYEDVVDEADWAPGRKSHVVRFIAEKSHSE
jgi:SAM-dependent methyltransferase